MVLGPVMRLQGSLDAKDQKDGYHHQLEPPIHFRSKSLLQIMAYGALHPALSTLSLAFAAAAVCHCIFPGASAPPQANGCR